MKTLLDLTNDQYRSEFIQDCVELIDNEVKGKKGISGVAIKTSYALLKKIKPRIIRSTVKNLLYEFLEAIQPFYQKYQEDEKLGTFKEYLELKAEDVAKCLLGITDNRVEKSTNKTVFKVYNKLRPKAKSNVEQAVPGIGETLDKYIKNL